MSRDDNQFAAGFHRLNRLGEVVLADVELRTKITHSPHPYRRKRNEHGEYDRARGLGLRVTLAAVRVHKEQRP